MIFKYQFLLLVPVLSYSASPCPEVPSMKCEFVMKPQPYLEKIEQVCEDVPQEVCGDVSSANCTLGYTEQCSFIPVRTCKPGETKPVCRLEMKDNCQNVTQIVGLIELKEKCSKKPKCIKNLDCKMEPLCQNVTEQVCEEDKKTICKITFEKMCRTESYIPEHINKKTCSEERVCTEVSRTVCELVPAPRVIRSADQNCRSEKICKTKEITRCKTTPDIVRTCKQPPRTVCTAPRGRWGGSSCRSVPAQDCVERKVFCLTRPEVLCKNEIVCDKLHKISNSLTISIQPTSPNPLTSTQTTPFTSPITTKLTSTQTAPLTSTQTIPFISPKTTKLTSTQTAPLTSTQTTPYTSTQTTSYTFTQTIPITFTKTTSTVILTTSNTPATSTPAKPPTSVHSELVCTNQTQKECKPKRVCKPEPGALPPTEPNEICRLVPIKSCQVDVSIAVCREKNVEKCDKMSVSCETCTNTKVCKDVKIKVPYSVKDLICTQTPVQICSTPEPSCSVTQEKVCRLVPTQCNNVSSNCRVVNTRVCKPVKRVLTRLEEDKVCKLVMIKTC